MSIRNISNQIEWESEQYLCAIEVLDKLNVPKEDENGNTYSIVGRIYELIRMGDSINYPERTLSDNDYVTNILNNM